MSSPQTASSTSIGLYGGSNGNPASVTRGGNLGTQLNFDTVSNIGRVVLRAGKVYRFQDIPCTMLFIYNPATNGNVWWAGFDTNVPAVGVGTPILPGEVEEIECPDANQISLIPEVDGNSIFAIVLASNSTAIVIPGNPPAFTNTPPTLAYTAPPINNATNISVSATITVTASTPVDPATVNNTTVTASPTMTAVISVDSANPANITVLPTTNLSNSTTYTINYGTGIADLNGNNLATTFVLTFTTAATTPPPDTTPPTVVSANPGGDTTNVNLATTPSILFSEPIFLPSVNPTNVTAFIVKYDEQIPGLVFTLSTDLQTLYINNMPLSASTSYQINILGGVGIGLTDLAGNNLASSYVISFTTSAISSNIVYSVAGNAYDNLQGTNGNVETGILLNSNRSKLVGIIPNNYTVILKAVGALTGIVYLVWERSNDNGQSYSDLRAIGSITASTIPTLSEQIYTFNDSGNTNTMQYFDFIAVRYQGGNSSNYLQVKISNYDAFDGSNTCNGKFDYTFNNGNIYTSVDMAGTISASS